MSLRTMTTAELAYELSELQHLLTQIDDEELVSRQPTLKQAEWEEKIREEAEQHAHLHEYAIRCKLRDPCARVYHVWCPQNRPLSEHLRAMLADLRSQAVFPLQKRNRQGDQPWGRRGSLREQEW